MAQLNFNAATVEPTQSFDPLPDGWYVAMITKSEMKPTKDSATTGNAYLEMELTCQEPPFKGRKVFYRLNIKNANPTAQEIAYRQLSALCHATGVIQVQDSQQLHGIPFRVKVTVRKDDSGKYDPTNEVKAVKGVNEGVENSAMPATGFAAPASQGTTTPAAAATPAPANAGLPPWMMNKG